MSKGVTFQRDAPPIDEWRTFAWRRYSRDHQELNRYYWTTALAIDVTRSHASAGPTHDASVLLARLGMQSTAAAGVNDRHYTIVERLDEAKRWLRLNTLLGALSALERYITAVGNTALCANPTLSLSWPKKIDGLTLQKHGIPLKTLRPRQLREGDWQKRIAIYTQTFGEPPPEYKNAKPSLEAMSQLRNRIAHEFGSDESDSADMSSVRVLAGIRRSSRQGADLSEAELIGYLGTMEQTSSAIDKHLLDTHIGGFEVPSIYLMWNEDRDAYEEEAGAPISGHNRTEDQRFTNFISQFSVTINSRYYQKMLTYLRRL